ncbi:S8 family serine peptidase [Bacillus suaedae]|uniref:S8 family serine peptidase n=1 Tax=Halalkalibacter suaedae TaxID=2822140 RepID=A0A940X1I8_9BACI|nr:S8 family serine peptidase [Bacillus suaedae]MBP3953139.1 S8 family serine peptidase [Bacillus suaedae]
MNKNLNYLLFFASGIIILVLLILVIRNDNVPSSEGKATPQQKIENWALDYVGSDSSKVTDPIKIAILDSGINKKHKEFNDVIFKEYNVIAPDEKITDDLGHGTAIAGIIAAKGIKTTGIIQNVILYDVKVLNEKGQGKIEDVVEGIEWSIKQNVDMINISFGFSSDKAELKSSIEKAIEQNIVITAAAGNTLGLTVDFPAQYNDVLSISSFDKHFKLDPFSGVGKIDYSAPGVEVISTDNKGSYSTFSGTSFATAYATGVIATILNDPSVRNTDIKKEKLLTYVVKLGAEEQFGEGFLTLKKEKVEELLYEKELD